MKIGVLALQGDFAEHVAILQILGVDTIEVRLPEHLSAIDGLIIPGGESTTISRLLLQWGLLEPLRERLTAGMAVWGTCAGAILLAHQADLDRDSLQAMDISIERNAFGRQVDSFEADLDVPVLSGEPFHAVFIRAPRISRVGARARTLAQLPDGTVVAARQDHLLATVFHPELTHDSRFHQYFLTLVGAPGAEVRKVAARE
jgi:5'-phosphate synthase pdxT subunit